MNFIKLLGLTYFELCSNFSKNRNRFEPNNLMGQKPNIQIPTVHLNFLSFGFERYFQFLVLLVMFVIVNNIQNRRVTSTFRKIAMNVADK